jgi:glycosyltransferase involved in cell wall biosynthesis
MPPLLSLCMIVRNEASTLEKCLNSVASLVDEIIIIDTGSSDATKEIALRYTNHVYNYLWNNDFAAARNESLRYATGEWILVLDADEYIQSSGHNELRQDLIAYQTDKPMALVARIHNRVGDGYDETNIMESSGARLFNNYRTIRYQNPIHEQLISDRGPVALQSISFIIHHTGYTNEALHSKNKSARNMAILDKISSTVNKQDPYYNFILGNEYYKTFPAKARDAYQLAYQHSKLTDNWFLHLMDRYISLEISLNNYLHAYELIKTMQQLMPNITDYLCIEGILLESLGFQKRASHVLRTCIQLAEHQQKQNEPYWAVQPTYGVIVPHQLLAEISFKQGDIDTAIHHWQQLLQHQSKNLSVLSRLIEQLTVRLPLDYIIAYLDQIYPIQQSMNGLMLFKISLSIGHEQLAWHYSQHIYSTKLPIEYQDLIALALLKKESLAVEENVTLPAKLAATVAIVAGDLHAATIQEEKYFGLTKLALDVLNGGSLDCKNITYYENELLALLKQLYIFGLEYHYLILIQNLANASILNNIANWLYNRGNIADAIEIFEVLLSNDALEADGMLNVGQWHLNNGDMEGSAPFFIKAFRQQPSVQMIGLLEEGLSLESYRELRDEYCRLFPDMREFWESY